MRLDALKIATFKNLRDFEIDFDETSPYTVFVGENGAGKSNLIEAITLIFRNLDLDLPAPFSYELTYECRGNQIRVAALENMAPECFSRKSDSESFAELSKKDFMAEDENGRPLYRPAFVFGYYSGPSDRLAKLYEKHRERYYQRIIQPPEKRRQGPLLSNSLRRLFFAQNLHGQFALLAFFMAPESDQENDRSFLREHLQIDGLDSVLFVLKRPPWASKSRRGGDKRFWNAEGEVKEFLIKLYEQAKCPARMPRRVPTELAKAPLVECLYLFLSKPEELAKVYKSYESQYAFFTALESTYISQVLGEVRTRVRTTHAVGSGSITYRDLSEGEQQLLLVLGLLKFTAEDEALFLLDEPDTHLNPAWSTQYLDFLDRFIQGRETCHIVMSSHDPLVFSRLRKSEVRVFRRNAKGVVVAEQPLQDPRGMGVQAILSSDLFRLRSGGLDLETQGDLDLQRKLSAKGHLSEDEELQLRQVTTRLHELGFWKADRDPLYQVFLQKWAEREKPEWLESVELTPEQMKQRDELAAEIAGEIASQKPAS